MKFSTKIAAASVVAASSVVMAAEDPMLTVVSEISTKVTSYSAAILPIVGTVMGIVVGVKLFKKFVAKI